MSNQAQLFLSQRNWNRVLKTEGDERQRIVVDVLNVAHGFGLKTPVLIFVYSQLIPPPGPVGELKNDLTIEVYQ